jgi:hypothetical protein
MLHAKQAQTGGRGIALPMLGPGTRRQWIISATPQLLYLQEKALLPIVKEVGWDLGPVWMGSNLLPCSL